MGARSTAAWCLSVLLAGGGLYAIGFGPEALQAVGLVTPDPRDGRHAPDGPTVAARTLEWTDLLPPDEAGAGLRLRNGALPRGVVQHGELTAGGATSSDAAPSRPSPFDLALILGGTGNLDGPPRRIADTFGGIGNLRGLQPRGGAARGDLDGQRIRIAGFVTPLAFEGTAVSEFLLVPYVGACIHVPPPPANQIVFVSGARGLRPDGGLVYPVWITGTLRAVARETEYASVGYQIDAAWVERYE